MRCNVLQNLHLSRLMLDEGVAKIVNNKTVIVDVKNAVDMGAAPSILGLLQNGVLKSKKDSALQTDIYFFGVPINQIYDIYFVNLTSFIADWNSVLVKVENNIFAVRVDWCTNFYNAYDDLAWFPYIENPSFMFSFITVGVPIENQKTNFFYLAAYFNLGLNN